MSEYTKGPWIMIENHTNISIATGQYADGGHQVAFVAGNPNLPNRRANARLMSSAPEILEALKVLTEDAEEVARRSYSVSGTNFDEEFRAEDPDQYERVQVAKAAIAKAEGR